MLQADERNAWARKNERKCRLELAKDNIGTSGGSSEHGQSLSVRWRAV